MQVRKRKTFTLRLSKFELLHLRDLLSVMVPPELKQTVSQQLAAAEDRTLVETHLWNSVVDACKEAELPLGPEAPNYIVTATSSPSIGVFRLADDPQDGLLPAAEATVKGPFDDSDEAPEA
jgi:hypothetical protein